MAGASSPLRLGSLPQDTNYSTVKAESFGLTLLATILLTLTLGWLYWPTLLWLTHAWNVNEYYAHGPMLPLVTAYLIWRQRTGLTAAWHAASYLTWRSPLLLCLGLSVQFAGRVADMYFIQALSLPIVLLGITHLLKGPALSKPMRFPLLFLLMAVPLPVTLAIAVSGPLQNYAAACAASGLRLLRFPITRDGVNLHTPRFDLIIAAPCSGLKTAVALLTMALLIAYLVPRLNQQARCLVVLLSLPVALLANVLRITIIMLIGHYVGAKAAEGFLHAFSGFLMFGVSLGILGALSSPLDKIGWVQRTPKIEARPQMNGRCLRLWQRQALVIALLAATQYTGLHAMTVDTTPKHSFEAPAMALRTVQGHWRGTPMKVDEAAYTVLNADAASQEVYALEAVSTPANGTTAHRVAVPHVETIAIYCHQWGNFHSPAICLRCGGWEVTKEETHEIRGTVDGTSQALTVNLLTAKRHQETTYLAYAFLAADQATHGWLPHLLKSSTSRLLGHSGIVADSQDFLDARLLRHSNGVAEVQFDLSNWPASKIRDYTPQLNDLMLRVGRQAQNNLK